MNEEKKVKSLEWTCKECGEKYHAIVSKFNENIVTKLCEQEVCLSCLEKIQQAHDRQVGVRMGEL